VEARREIKFHDLRVTFITNALTHGATLPLVMSIVVHSRTRTTDVYLRLAGVNVMGATGKISDSVPNDSDENVLILGINNQ